MVNPDARPLVAIVLHRDVEFATGVFYFLVRLPAEGGRRVDKLAGAVGRALPARARPASVHPHLG
jgi:hypothetical protein